MLRKVGDRTNTEDKVRLVKHLDGMPLVITQAATYTERVVPRITVVEYTDKLQQVGSERIAIL